MENVKRTWKCCFTNNNTLFHFKDVDWFYQRLNNFGRGAKNQDKLIQIMKLLYNDYIFKIHFSKLRNCLINNDTFLTLQFCTGNYFLWIMIFHKKYYVTIQFHWLNCIHFVGTMSVHNRYRSHFHGLFWFVSTTDHFVPFRDKKTC